jgi:hypothetical protein
LNLFVTRALQLCFLMASVLFSGQEIPSLTVEQQRRVDWILGFAADKSALARDIRDFDLLVTRGRIHKYLGYRVVGSYAPKKKADSEGRHIPEEFPREMFHVGKKISGKVGPFERKRASEKGSPEKKRSPEKRKFSERRLPEKRVVSGERKPLEKGLPERKALPDKRAVPVRAASRKVVPETELIGAKPDVRQESSNLGVSSAEARTKPASDKGKGKVTGDVSRKEEVPSPKIMVSAMRSHQSAVPLPKPKVKPTVEICGASTFEPIVMLTPGAPSRVLPSWSDSEGHNLAGEKRSREEDVCEEEPEKRQKVDHAQYFDAILGRHLASHPLPDLGDANIVPTGLSPVASSDNGLFDPPTVGEEVSLPMGSGEAVVDQVSCLPEEEVSARVLGADQPYEVIPPSPAVASVECPAQETPTVGGSGFWGPLLSSLGEGLTGHPLQVLSSILPQGHSRGAGRVSPEEFVDLLIHQKITVSFVGRVSICFSAVHRLC